jgi:hypothetical protein
MKYQSLIKFSLAALVSFAFGDTKVVDPQVLISYAKSFLHR